MADTQYDEKERLVFFKHIATFNLNPFAAWLVFQEYAKNVHPLPVRYEWRDCEITIRTAGYLGIKRGNPDDCNPIALRLLMKSYLDQLGQSNLPVSFQLANAVEFHLTKKGVSDHARNPMRNIFNPT